MYMQIHASLLPHPNCPLLPLVVRVGVQSGGGQSNWPSAEEYDHTEDGNTNICVNIVQISTHIANANINLHITLLTGLHAIAIPP